MGDHPAEGSFLALDVVEGEVERWLAMHAVARRMYEALPPADQAVIRRDGAPSIMHLGMLVGTRPDVRELAESILKQVADASRRLRAGDAPRVIQADGHLAGRLSQGERMIVPAEKTDAGNGAEMTSERLTPEYVDGLELRLAQVQAQRDELVQVVSLLRSMAVSALAGVSDGSEECSSDAGGQAAVGF